MQMSKTRAQCLKVPRFEACHLVKTVYNRQTLFFDGWLDLNWDLTPHVALKVWLTSLSQDHLQAWERGGR
jgi:hypothetical protein